MGARELDDRIQISSLSDIKAALPKIATELKRAKVRHNKRAVRPAHLVSRTDSPLPAAEREGTIRSGQKRLRFVGCRSGDPSRVRVHLRKEG